jgi:hypothetical protein
LQPLDFNVLKPLKSVWKAIVSEYYLNNNFDNISKSVFPSLLKKIYEKALQPQHAAAGFVKTGLFPLNREKIDATRCATTEPFDDSSLTSSVHSSPPSSSSTNIPLAVPPVSSSSLTIATTSPISTKPLTSSIVTTAPISTSPISTSLSNNSTPNINLPLSSSRVVPLYSSTPEVSRVNSRKTIVESRTNESNVVARQLNSLSESILSQLQINHAKKNDNKKTRIDTNGIGGKVLNEASTKAIIQAKEDKKSEKLQKQIENLEKKTIASDNKAKMLLKTAEKNKLKILNLKK